MDSLEGFARQREARTSRACLVVHNEEERAVVDIPESEREVMVRLVRLWRMEVLHEVGKRGSCGWAAPDMPDIDCERACAVHDVDEGVDAEVAHMNSRSRSGLVID